ncbi:MAG TPA: protein kinase [Candidatus Polarisedimenticolia bacterium]|nr:protein kinase [Candidatus Polarisedimenticolia bacterium]
MPLSPGAKLGNYEIVGPLGAGGMGEVYRARDPRLGREVALKIIPEIFANEPDRVARFEREARALAALQHPNIASLFGFEEAGSRRYLVMELVEGDDLSQRIAQGATPVDEALEIARQIAEGLEAAHEKGIVHRDLKPANIKITPDGRVKILDFGLARAYLGDSAEMAAQETMNSPTMTAGMTRQGMILGTAAYMSPEQARGKPADRRADLWAFGVILFEMLSGRRLFEGETISDILASVLKNSPDWTLLPAETPVATRRLLERCLAKDPRRRLRSAGDSLLDLESSETFTSAAAAPAAPVPAARHWREIAAWVVAGAALLLLLLRWLPVSGARPPAYAQRTISLEIGLPSGQRVSAYTPPVVSPDGRRIVYGTSDSAALDPFSGEQLRGQLWMRSLGSFASEPLANTAGAQFPFWSPDSSSIAYFQEGFLRRMDLESRLSTNLYERADLKQGPRGGAWLKDGTILFAPSPNSGIFRVSANGGEAVEVTHVDPQLPDGSHRFPVALPDGEHFLFLIWSNNAEALRTAGGIYLASLKGGPIRRVLSDASSAVVLPSGYLLLRRSEHLTAVPFDLTTFTAEAGKRAIPIDTAEMYDANMGLVPVSVSLAGDIAYNTGLASMPSTPIWLDLQGHETPIPAPESRYASPVLSRDGKRYALTRWEGSLQSQIWIGDLDRGTLVPLTHGVNDSYDPMWAPDGTRVAFVNRDTGSEDIYMQPVEATSPREPVFKATLHDTQLSGWSEDGRYLLFVYGPQTGASRYEIWVYDFQEKKARAILTENFAVREPALSSDGRYLAYTSEESGRPQIFVQPFPKLDRKWLISPQAGAEAHWKQDGKEIWYIEPKAGGHQAMSVSIQETAGTLAPGTPKALLTFSSRIAVAVPDPAHTRWLALRESQDEVPSSLRVVLNWSPDHSH